MISCLVSPQVHQGYFPKSYWDMSIKYGRPLALQPECGSLYVGLFYNKLAWGYWGPLYSNPYIMDVDAYKFLEPRHLTLICNRWSTNHTVDLQQSLFNGNIHSVVLICVIGSKLLICFIVQESDLFPGKMCGACLINCRTETGSLHVVLVRYFALPPRFSHRQR
jgi:hypothetical protein